MATVMMERLLLERKLLRRRFTISAKKLETLLVQKGDLMNIKAEFTKLSQTFEDLRALQNQIFSSLLDSETQDEERLEAESDAADVYDSQWHMLSQKVHDLSLREPRSECSGKTVKQAGSYFEGAAQGSRNLRLPKLELPAFDGKIYKWLAFWAQFKKIDEDENLSNEDKFQYLLQSMEHGSNARELVMSYPPSSDNYSKVLEQLKERFARDDLLIEYYVRQLLQLVLEQNNKALKVSTRALYDKLMTQILALESLDVTQDKYASLLYPMVESALPEDTLRAWNRFQKPGDEPNQLSKLLKFLKREVESEERISMARSGFSQTGASTPSASVLANTRVGSKNADVTTIERVCLWCDKSGHSSSECNTAIMMTLEKRKEFIKKKNACFICLRPHHSAKRCRKYPKCIFCGGRHYTLMCNNMVKSTPETMMSKPAPRDEAIANQSSFISTNTVLLPTVKLNVVINNTKFSVRALLDSGAQRTFVKKSLVERNKMVPTGKQEITHVLFGGVVTKKETHNVYELLLESFDGQNQTKIEALDQRELCGFVPIVRNKSILSALKEKGVDITDCTNDITEVSLLIGSDFLGSILTGRSVHVDDNLIAVETKMGWSIQGPVVSEHHLGNSVSTLFCSFDVDDLWKLETLGIRDESEVKRQKVVESEVLDFFESTVHINDEGRYEVKLPWKDIVVDLPSNYNIALRRLKSGTSKLEKLGILNDCNEVFKEWQDSGIIEVVEQDDENVGHYLPHHVVIKESSATTKLRPVFDASASTKNNLTLNACLEKGVNFIELIPRLLTSFRKGAIGITADIKKAFLQISIQPEERDYFKFLWWADINDQNEGLKTFRHCRVVFGVTTSPFLLSATILHHLMQFEGETADKLKRCFYVDNCVLSVDCEQEMNRFIDEAKQIMNQGKFELRCWLTGPAVTSDETTKMQETSILGLIWDPIKDELFCKLPTHDSLSHKYTKRLLLSLCQSIFDPIGFTCPTTLVPKILIQQCWDKKIDWDDKLPQNVVKVFKDWLNKLNYLSECRIPRRISSNILKSSNNTLHIFCDASQVAYSSCIFLRSELNGVVSVQLILAKTRVVPLKPITVPRLELIAALLGTRLAAEVKTGLDIACKEYYWTDSSIVLAWITRQHGLNVFVHNRVKEIINRTEVDDWRHVPGCINPADLPSRGCDARQLRDSRWWEGPSWLRLEPSRWPNSEPEPNEEEVNKEIRKSLLTTHIVDRFSDRLLHFGKYSKIVRVVAWCLRFMKNCQQSRVERITGDVLGGEYNIAEGKLILILQKESYTDLGDTQLKLGFKVFKDNFCILRVKTRLILSDDSKNFISPILLPGDHPIVERLVEQKHKQKCHAGSESLVCILREDYWIVGIRRLAKRIVRRCVSCRRHSVKSRGVPTAPLPLNRVHCGDAFEVTGVDFAGPLLLKSGEKAWIVLFTCATYRAVHIELSMSLSTESFLLAFRRFLARRGNVKLIYSDNGTNFKGTSNLLATIKWQEVASTSSLSKIEWRFIPPHAPWWGGFWERMIRSVKEVLRRMLGRAALNQAEMTTVLCEVENLLNSRPLTYVCNNNDSLVPLTPNMFLHCKSASDNAEALDYINSSLLTVRLRYIKQLKDNLKQRFRSEYLSLLTDRFNTAKLTELKIGDVVLIGADNVKRVDWPLGVIIKIFPGVDGISRVAEVRTASGIRVRPLQRLFPLECLASNEHNDVSQPLPESPAASAISKELPTSCRTRAGRVVKVPRRLDL